MTSRHIIILQFYTKTNYFIFQLENVTLISLTPKELSSRYICDNHFISTDYTNENKLRLNKHAVPVQYKDI